MSDLWSEDRHNDKSETGVFRNDVPDVFSIESEESFVKDCKFFKL